MLCLNNRNYSDEQIKAIMSNLAYDMSLYSNRLSSIDQEIMQDGYQIIDTYSNTISGVKACLIRDILTGEVT